jgi:hypothetical protein
LSEASKYLMWILQTVIVKWVVFFMIFLCVLYL